MEKLLNNITAYLYGNDNYDENTKEVIYYGLEILILKIVFWITAALIGLFMGMFFENLIYMVFFVLLRSYAGGYHSKSRLRCFVLSTLTIILSICVHKIFNIFDMVNVFLVIFGIFSFAIVFLLSPIDSKNKELDNDEVIIFRKKARIILCSETILAIITYIFGLPSISKSIMLAIVTVGTLVIVGYINQKTTRIFSNKNQ